MDVCDPDICDPDICDPDVCDPDICDLDVCDLDICDPGVCDHLFVKKRFVTILKTDICENQIYVLRKNSNQTFKMHFETYGLHYFNNLVIF